MRRTDNLRIKNTLAIITPAQLDREFPIATKTAEAVEEGRDAVTAILEGRDPRMLGIIGPCSIHDEAAALDYAERLKSLRRRVEDRIYLIMRVYFEKPRTTIGWKGLITDPHLNDSDAIEDGLRLARKLLKKVSEKNIPVAAEMLDPIIPQYLASLITWAAIGARTTESQAHRNLASGLSMPVGFKNSTDGSLITAINALESAINPHNFMGIDKDGRTCILSTTGNRSVHIILRGGRGGPNYQKNYVEEAEQGMTSLGLKPAIIVDCSHANSGKDPRRQGQVLQSVLEQRTQGRRSLVGFMLESNINEGNQKILPHKSAMKYGVSVTDPCLGWEDTEELVGQAYKTLGEFKTYPHGRQRI